MKTCSQLKGFLCCICIAVLFLFRGICGQAAETQNVSTEAETPSLLAETVEKEVAVNIRKRVQWVDENNGDAKITLQYASNSGELLITQDMNVVLIHDKSGSMDVNFGYHLEKERQGWENADKAIAYPLLNDKQWSETILETGSETDLESEGVGSYLQRINQPNSYTSGQGADTGYVQTDTGSAFLQYEAAFNSSCQMDGHYYLLVKDDARSGISAWKMVQGKNLYNIENTDFHHYVMIEAEGSKSARDCAVEFIEQGRRVVRMTTDSEVYYSENGETKVTETLYFLDVSMLECYEEQWILNTCGEAKCPENDRLEKSRQFMTALATHILNLNLDNKIAYIPFWGSVPENGSWKNYKGNDRGDGLVDISHYESLITSREGVNAIDFTSDPQILQEQIAHPFTYNGTNWAKAFDQAITFLDNRSEEDKEKETLVLFLTDGMPQGTEGLATDYQNPSISGIVTDSSGKLVNGSAYQLKDIDGVTVWAVGVGINEQDTTGLKDRLKLINDDGQPFYARYTADFESLKTDVFEKIEKTYVEKFYATDAFYQDTLSEYFELDTSNLDRTWKILSESPEETLVHGVPQNVYDAVRKNGTDTGITKVYVRNTKTIYWYVGEMTNGGYDQEGHTLEIPIQFLKYSEHTGGADKALAANSSQYMTYHTTLKPDTLYTVTIDTPKLVFHRTDSEITVLKNVAESKDDSRVFHFSYSKEKYTAGTVKNVTGSFEIIIPAGAVSASAVLRGLEDGIYYIYETDRNHKIVNPVVCEAVVDYDPTISTKLKNSKIPWSVTGSDGAALRNQDNYLILGSTDAVAFEKGAELTVVKEIDTTDDQIWWEHGNPTFLVRIHGNGLDGKEYTFYHTFEFTKEYVEQNATDGKASMSHTFTDIPVSENYIVEESRVSRYKLAAVSAKTEDGQPIGKVSDDAAEDDISFYSLHAEVDLKLNPKGVSVTLYNRKVNDTWFNHITSVKNIINSLE